VPVSTIPQAEIITPVIPAPATDWIGPQTLPVAAVQKASDIGRSFNELHAIYRMVNAVSRAVALDEIYAAALDELQGTLGADRASVLLFDPDGIMRFKAWRGLSDEYRTTVEGHTPWSRDATDPQPILVPDVKSNSDLASYGALFEKEGIAALGFIPLVDAGRLLGKFMIYFNSPHVVQPAELQLAQTIASHIAFSISRKNAENDLREAEKAQRQLAEAAHEANFAKSQFLAMMSHELRTPLNAIGGYAELLEMELHGSLTEEQRQDVSRIQRSQRHLLGLINDLLNFARIETGHIDLRDEQVSLEDALVGVEVIVAPAISAKKIHYRRERSAEGISCRGDRDKIGQILLNLVSNAVKFTGQEGEITLDWTSQPGDVAVHVVDSGPGIPAEKLELIFEPFVQLKTLERLAEGAGLGLAISRELARAMGGDVTVKSELNKGSTFTLVLPRT
jgi:signal transduction histidine kinase